MVERQDRDPGAARRHRRRGGGVVRRTVLRAVLPDPDAEGACGRRADHDRDRACDRHAVLHPVRLAVRQDRPQADHDGGLCDRGADLLPDLRGASPTSPIRSWKRRWRHRRWSSPPIRPSARSSSRRPAPRSSPRAATRIKAALVGLSVNYENVTAPKGTAASGEDRQRGHSGLADGRTGHRRRGEVARLSGQRRSERHQLRR